MNNLTFEDVQSLCDTIESQNSIINQQIKYIAKLHQILAMHEIEIIENDEKKEK